MPSSDSAAQVRNPMFAEEDDEEDNSDGKAVQLRPEKSGAAGDQNMRSSMDGRKKGSAAAIAAFRLFDTDASGTLGAEDLARMLETLELPNDAKAVQSMLKGAEGMSLAEFVAWHHKQEAEGHLEVAQRKTTRTVQRRVESGVKVLQSTVQGAQEVASRAVVPESLFVMDKRGNETTRQQADATQRILETFSSQFRHLEEHVRYTENATLWTDVWQRVAKNAFDEETQRENLGWSVDLMAVALDEIIVVTGQRGYAKALFRAFLRTSASSVSGLVQAWFEAGCFERAVQSAPTTTCLISRAAARAFAGSRREELEELLGDEQVPVRDAVGAVKGAMGREVTFRREKIKVLTQRLESLPADVPVNINVSGLRGDAAAANGLYVASGQFFGGRQRTKIGHQRRFFGRPIFSQRGGGHSLFYDAMWSDGEWIDGVWALGPTMTSDRCTAWLSEADLHQPAGSPPPTAEISPSAIEQQQQQKTPRWMVYDPIKSVWSSAPGHHCPNFTVDHDTAGGTLAAYLQQAISDHTSRQRRAEERLAAAGFEEDVRVTMTARAGPFGISRSQFLAWCTASYEEELREMQTALERQIVEEIPLAFALADEEDNHVAIRSVVSDFISNVQRSGQDRKQARQRLVLRIARPAMARAFFSWKLLSRRAVSSTVLQGNSMFQEPQLPWNVRHPQSDFTASWEGCQAFLLVYIAFALTWRLCFNEMAAHLSFWWFFEVGIDLYFTIDVIMNFHTAFYDESGDLQGLKVGGDSVGQPDLRLLYTNYGKGWMLIDVASILPVNLIADVVQSQAKTDSGASELQLLKALRLLRLSKLLRLARAVRIFKKYEEVAGPTLKAIMLVGSVLLLGHSVTCAWFVAGTLDTGTSGWVEHKFTLSDSVCRCHNITTVYYDSVERVCVNADDDEAPTLPTCAEATQSVPSLSTYYLQSLMTSITNPSLDDS